MKWKLTFSVLGWKCTCSCVGDRSGLGFSVEIEINVVFAQEVEVDFCVRTGNALFWCIDRNYMF